MDFLILINEVEFAKMTDAERGALMEDVSEFIAEEITFEETETTIAELTEELRLLHLFKYSDSPPDIEAVAEQMPDDLLFDVYKEHIDTNGDHEDIAREEIALRISGLPTGQYSTWPKWAQMWIEDGPPSEFKDAFYKKISEESMFCHPPETAPGCSCCSVMPVEENYHPAEYMNL